MKIDSARLEGDRLILQTSGMDAKQFVYGFRAGDYDIVPHKEKRSLDANGFMWSLCREIGDAMQMPPREVYREAIRRVGIYKDFPPLPEKDAKTLQTAWERQGIGWVTEKLDYGSDGDSVVIRCYYGSSVYTKRQMSRLIDDLVQDADNLGLSTPGGDRINSLLEEWDGEKQKSGGT